MNDFFSLVQRTRSCRRFNQDPLVDAALLESCVKLARMTASAANLQPLKYILSCNANTNQAIYDCLGWAGYLKDWPGPVPDERPTGYIVMLGDQHIAKNFDMDIGIAAQTIMLGAYNQGFAGCMLANIRHQQLSHHLEIADHLKILLVLALGAPKESIVIEPVNADGNCQYYRDEQGIHHVPKRSLDELIVHIYQ
ncbi:MAG: Nitroreductase family protein [Candidatus Magnetoglobus multicellularis str. Araruama]|uniref:Nitroreductase family protein n=1 Tax=Candidatus Magnetoglobus multicellularis str. Araruama TaxID=890399 RepID=A0A1V1PF50_9BACT|nr:MAG: Nitroreductase family protein [Candidatus Magnetoglobus multicellularis str. Araruama]